MTTAALIVAAGRGMRAKTPGEATPKQYLTVGGQMILTRTIGAFARHAEVDQVLTVIHPDDRNLYAQAVKGISQPLCSPVDGGETRQDSVLTGLRSLAQVAPSRVLIHDGARPFVTPELIKRVLDALDRHPGALPAVPVRDTLKRVADDIITQTVDRTGLWQAQTPQGFRYGDIVAAHEAAERTGRNDFTDDASIAEWQGLSVAVVEGAVSNSKVTNAEDLLLAEQLLQTAEHPVAGYVRVGSGFDVHAFGDGDHVVLCGVRLKHDRSLKGHSDADVGLHALTDALLGAIGDGDIGTHFPPADLRWAGADSDVFLRDAVQRVDAKRGQIQNVDVTLICEAPKIGPHRDEMRQRIAEILEINIGQVSVKATTTERLGFAGRREGIAAMASATVWTAYDEAIAQDE